MERTGRSKIITLILYVLSLHDELMFSTRNLTFKDKQTYEQSNRYPIFIIINITSSNIIFRTSKNIQTFRDLLLRKIESKDFCGLKRLQFSQIKKIK